MGISIKKGGNTTSGSYENMKNIVEDNTVDKYDVVEYNIQSDKNDLTERYVDSQEIDNLVSTICVSEPDTIVSFGKEAAVEISKCSDMVLNSMSMSQINDTGIMLKSLGKIMDKFDLNEITKNPGFFGKIFGKGKNFIERILEKYYTMGSEVDKIYINLKQYENEIKESNKKLESMFTANRGYYQDLLKYILAGEQGIKEVNQYIEQKNQEFSETQSGTVKFELESLVHAREMLEQRVHDLKISENIAMQAIPMLKNMQFNNLNLVRKINSAFIITLPVFKQALSQAILLKRQKIQAEAMSALDERTNEMLLKNAQNTAEQSKLTAQLAAGSSVKIETLEKTWKTIVKGIEETRQIQEETSRKRKEDQKRLEAIKEDFNKVFGK